MIGIKNPSSIDKSRNLHCFKLHRSYSIPFSLLNDGENFWTESERTVSEFRKRKRNFDGRSTKRIFLEGRVTQAFVSAAPSQANYLIEYCIY